ncbi:EAL domain-containing protein [Ectobacillus sp. JY-23]|uniref:sensor domain-containing protein n=1 Tax=Ectobacillus sp. JY-23 TaxID=2933872 RepID=UPI001FF37E73|nr:EAL domain-containing protein [Ectobacillus sp. JY-23]UOY91258.1 EAL domain-containing protein [Ectobacillus sp. JY-23]
MEQFQSQMADDIPSHKYITNRHYLRFFLPYIVIIILLHDIVTNAASHQYPQFVLLALCIVLCFRQFYMWRENRTLVLTYQSLQERLEDKINEGIQALAKNELHYKTLFENHPDAVFSLDTSGNFQAMNVSCTNIFHYSHKELAGRPLLNYVTDPYRHVVRDAIRHAKSGKPQTFDILFNETHLQVTFIPTMLGTKCIGMYGIAKDMTELKEKQQQVEHMAFHDALTGLANRRQFEMRLEEAMKLATKRETMVAVLFIDLDRFKKINDRLGHDVGDLLLIEIGQRLASALRSKDVVARQGGDEFTVFLTDVFSKKSAALVAERLMELLNEPVYIGSHELKITPSIGIAMYPSHGTNVTKLMKHADIAMYRAKASGKNKYMFYAAKMSDVEDEKHFLEGELSRALQNEELVLHYQPQVDLATKRIVGFEALLRWHHPKLGLVSPASFIPLAEETGLIIPMGEWIIRTACKQAATWRDGGYELKVGVNLSPLQFNQSNLVGLIAHILKETKLPPHLLDLEITEGIAMKKEEQVIKKLHQLKELGVQISIDDFGTGYSSLSYLTKYPIHTLKIAREFIREIGTSRQEEAIISSIVMMAKNLGLTVIAEGVETNAQWQFLKRQDCDHIQGFYISKPLPETEIIALLQKSEAHYR